MPSSFIASMLGYQPASDQSQANAAAQSQSQAAQQSQGQASLGGAGQTGAVLINYTGSPYDSFYGFPAQTRQVQPRSYIYSELMRINHMMIHEVILNGRAFEELKAELGFQASSSEPILLRVNTGGDIYVRNVDYVLNLDKFLEDATDETKTV